MCCTVCTNSPNSSCIRSVPVFQQLKPSDIDLLEKITESVVFGKGSFVFREEEQSDSLFVLHGGLIKLSKTSEDGKEHILRFLFPGDFLGQFALFQNKRHYAHAEVVEKAAVCRIRRSEFLPLIEQNPTLAYGFLLALSERLQQADEWAGAMHIDDVERRMAKLLIYFRHREQISHPVIRLPAAKKDLASMIGVTAETFSRKLTQFEAEGILAVDKRTIRVLNCGRLYQLAGTEKKGGIDSAHCSAI